MVLDFTLKKYTELINALLKRDYQFYHLQDIIKRDVNRAEKVVVLRHDVDRLPHNSLLMAQIEKSFGIKGTYYFRIVRESWDVEIMKKIASLGHEIGYHYEDVDSVNSELRIENGELLKKDPEKYKEMLIDLSYESFCKNLELFRRNFDVKTICMHGSPRAKYDNKIIWRKYNYKDLGLLGEPYYDIDFNEFAYFTDTGRRWNGHKYSVRDKVVSTKYAEISKQFKSTQQIMDNINKLPVKIMFTIHPERWNDSLVPWCKELVWQNVKNLFKRVIVNGRREKLMRRN